MKDSKGIPVITESFAPREIQPEDTWKVYLQASDPDGDMKAIYCVLDRPGTGPYPISITRIPEDQRRELSGFLFLNTDRVAGFPFGNLLLKLQIQDRAGNYSEPVSFSLSLSFNPRAQQEEAPPGFFQDKELGPIMITLTSGSPGV